MHNIWEFLLQTVSVTLVAALLLVMKRLFEDKLSPRWQYGIWSILALRILLPATTSRRILLPLPLYVETLKSIAEKNLSSAYTDVYQAISLSLPVPFLTDAPASLTDWLFLIYSAGVLFFLLRYLAAYLRLRHLLKKGDPITPALQNRIDAICEAHHLKCCHTVSVEGLSSAFVCGIFHPILALPANTDIDDKILLHELFHLKYRDALQNVLWCFLRALHWCNPLLVPIFHRIENDMESLCDQRVLEHLDGEDRREYGHILLSMANDTYARAPGTTSISNGGKNIARRIAAIVRFKKYPKGMALVSLCILFLLGIPSLVGTAATYDANYFTPKTEAGLTRSLAMTRIYRCNTMAGALDTYAKGLLLHNGIYLATASPLEKQAEYEAVMQNNLKTGSIPWYLPPEGTIHFPNLNKGYQLYNLEQLNENLYEVLLVLPVYNHSSVREYYQTKGGQIADENSHLVDSCYLMIPLHLWKEDGWVVEETGEHTLSLKQYEDTSYDKRSSDIPWLKTVTQAGATGTLTVSAKMSYSINNTINHANEFNFLPVSSTSFHHAPQPDAEFAEIRLETSTEYTCADNTLGIYPQKQLAIQTARLDSKEEISELDWPSEYMNMTGNVTGSSTQGYSWLSQTITTPTKDSYSLTDVAIDTLYDYEELPPELPYGHLIQIYWDSEFQEEFIIHWEDTP